MDRRQGCGIAPTDWRSGELDQLTCLHTLDFRQADFKSLSCELADKPGRFGTRRDRLCRIGQFQDETIYRISRTELGAAQSSHPAE